MKDVFINRLSRNLIEKMDFMPLEEENGELLVNDQLSIFQRTHLSKTVSLEIRIIDTLNLNTLEQELKCDNGSKGEGQKSDYIIKVMVFQGIPDEETINILRNQWYKLFHSVKLAFIVVSLDSRNIHLSLGMEYPYQSVQDIVRDCLLNREQDESVDLNDVITKKLEPPKSSLVDDSADFAESPVAHYTVYGYLILWLIQFAIFAMTGIYITLRFVEISRTSLPLLNAGYPLLFMFHINFLHLISNIAALLVIGEIVERNFNSRKLIFIMLFGGMWGGLVSLSIPLGFDINILNASAPVMAVCGAIWYMKTRIPQIFLEYKIAYYTFNTYIIFTLLYGAMSDTVSNINSLGAFTAGYLVSGLLGFEQEVLDWKKRRSYVLFLALLTGLFILSAILQAIYKAL